MQWVASNRGTHLPNMFFLLIVLAVRHSTYPPTPRMMPYAKHCRVTPSSCILTEYWQFCQEPNAFGCRACLLPTDTSTPVMRLPLAKRSSFSLLTPLLHGLKLTKFFWKRRNKNAGSLSPRLELDFLDAVTNAFYASWIEDTPQYGVTPRADTRVIEIDHRYST